MTGVATTATDASSVMLKAIAAAMTAWVPIGYYRLAQRNTFKCAVDCAAMTAIDTAILACLASLLA